MLSRRCAEGLRLVERDAVEQCHNGRTRLVTRAALPRQRAGMKQVHLAMELSKLPPHPTHNAKLEQYATDGDVAANWLMTVNGAEPFEDTDLIVDLGAGNGILGIGALILGAPRVVFVEKDPAACEAIEAGLDNHGFGRARAEVLCIDVLELNMDWYKCDTVIMNPPWGQQVRSADRPFLETALKLASRSVHLLHSAGAVHVVPLAADMGWDAEKWMETELPLPKRYVHQKKRRVFTDAAMWGMRPVESGAQEAAAAAAADVVSADSSS